MYKIQKTFDHQIINVSLKRYFGLQNWMLISILLLFSLLPPLLVAEENVASSPLDIDQSTLSEEQDRRDSISSKLNDIHADLQDRQRRLKELNRSISKADNDNDRSLIKAEINTLTQSMGEQKEAFEQILTGGYTLPNIAEDEAPPFDWQKDLMEILQPIMAELRSLTEQKRQMEEKKSRIEFHQQQVSTLSKALKHMRQIPMDQIKSPTGKQIKSSINEWQQQLEEHQHLLEVVELQLQELKRKSDESHEELEISSFIDGRLGTLTLSVGSALICYFMLRALMGLLRSTIFSRSRKKSKRTWQRLALLIIHLLAIIISVGVLFWVVNERGDRVLMGLFILLLLATILILRNSLPRYINEVKLMLNLGPVREGERIIYRGIPWRVENLNVYCRLSNPAMENESLRIPLYLFSEMESRKPTDDEPWFPCAVGDWVLVAGETFGQITHITPENVLMHVAGGSTLSLLTTDFLASQPRNLSKGFAVSTVFGIGYDHQAISTTEAPDLMLQYIEKQLRQQPYADDLKKVQVVFESAGASSLDYRIIAAFNGQAASSWVAIPRDLQRFAVEACNQHQWEIPFAQMVVHRSEG